MVLVYFHLCINVCVFFLSGHHYHARLRKGRQKESSELMLLVQLPASNFLWKRDNLCKIKPVPRLAGDTAGAYLSFCSFKELGVFVLSPPVDGMLVHKHGNMQGKQCFCMLVSA